jgi:hypothetical protein
MKLYRNRTEMVHRISRRKVSENPIESNVTSAVEKNWSSGIARSGFLAGEAWGSWVGCFEMGLGILSFSDVRRWVVSPGILSSAWNLVSAMVVPGVGLSK